MLIRKLLQFLIGRLQTVSVDTKYVLIFEIQFLIGKSNKKVFNQIEDK
jgi:hypothetical protein